MEPWLLTPLPHQQPGTPEYFYNEALCQSRSCVESTFGVLKSVFRCLNQERRLMYEPGLAGRIVNACAILHNMRIENQIANNFIDEGLREPAMNQRNLELDNEGLPQRGVALAQRIRDRLIHQVFRR